jgi:hypothetical protein
MGLRKKADRMYGQMSISNLTHDSRNGIKINQTVKQRRGGLREGAGYPMKFRKGKESLSRGGHEEKRRLARNQPVLYRRVQTG